MNSLGSGETRVTTIAVAWIMHLSDVHISGVHCSVFDCVCSCIFICYVIVCFPVLYCIVWFHFSVICQTAVSDDPIYSDPLSSFEEHTTAHLTTTFTTIGVTAQTQSKRITGNCRLLTVLLA